MTQDIFNEVIAVIYWYNKKYKTKVTVDSFKNEFNWDIVSQYYPNNLSEDFIREFKDVVNWNRISGHQKMSENFIREFKNRVWWYDISVGQKLSENFIREFKDKVEWKLISKYTKLSENFIREMRDRVDWESISQCQSLSKEFIIEFEDYVVWDLITTYQNVPWNFEYEHFHSPEKNSEKYKKYLQTCNLQASEKKSCDNPILDLDIL